MARGRARVHRFGSSRITTEWNGELFTAELRKTARSVVRQVTDRYLRLLLRRLTGPRTGRVYPLPGGGSYTASSPKEYPADRTGSLKGALDVSIRTVRGDVYGEVGMEDGVMGGLRGKEDVSRYAETLEHTKKKSSGNKKLGEGPRPYGRPYLSRAYKEIGGDAYIQAAVAKEFRRRMNSK